MSLKALQILGARIRGYFQDKIFGSAGNPRSLKISRPLFLKLTAALLVFLLSLLIRPFCTAADQSVYREVYGGLSRLGLKEGFLFYTSKLTSREYVHFFLSWLACRVMDRGLFIALSNALLAYVAMSLFLKWRLSAILAFVLIITNFYFLILYFAAERLKFAFIFLALSMLSIEHLRRFCSFAFLALLSHASVVLVYISTSLNFILRQISRFLRTGKVSRSFLLGVLFLSIPLLLMKYQIISKVHGYYAPRSLLELVKISVLLLLTLLYARKKGEVFLLFVPLVAAICLVGDSRINIFGYFIFLYYGSQVRHGWNFGVLATTLYFAYSSIGLLVNIFQYGHGFYSG